MRILGIDLGSSSVKAVELDSAFGRYEVHEYHELKVAPGESPVDTARALIQGLPRPPDRIAAALRTSKTTFRNLQMPTRDKKAIQAGVGFELDDDLPFALEDTVYDYAIVNQAPQFSEVHIAASLREHLETMISEWSAAGVDPDLITTEAWALRTLLNKIHPPQGADSPPSLLLMIGHDHTLLYAHHRGVPLLAREIPFGGRDLTQAIMARYEISAEQADAAKLDNGFVIPPSQREQATQEQIEFSDALQGPLQELLLEIRRASLTCKNISQQGIASIYLSGGTALLPGFGRLIEEEAQIPVQPLRALSAIAASGVTYSEPADAGFSLAAALALSMVGPERSRAINLRKGEFAKRGASHGFNFENLRKPLAAVGMVTLSLFLSLVVQNQVYQSKLRTVDAQLERSIRSFFGQLPSTAVRNYMTSSTMLKNRIDQELKKSREMASLFGPNARSPLDFLKGLSTTIPRDVVVDMVQFNAGASPTEKFQPDADVSASLTFLVSNPQMAERLASSVDKDLTGMTRSKIEEVTAPDGEGKRFKITFRGKPSEVSYGE